ncbi:MAG: hypothetical protein J7L88_06190 [Thermoplasmata archaeon]|nr:hypothetical protein [Thermoplasmata archaeon]
MLTLPLPVALILASLLAAGGTGGTPLITWDLNYNPTPPLTSPFIVRVDLQGEELNLTNVRMYIVINISEPDKVLVNKGDYRSELTLSNGTFSLFIPSPMRRFNFTFHLELQGEGVSQRYPTIGELPVSFTGDIVDEDGDGMDDRWEVENGLNPGIANDATADEDGDGLTNLEEYYSMTSPMKKDSDGDGMDDRWEVKMGTCPFLSDGEVDYDEDGATNLEEFHMRTDPRDPLSVPDLSPVTPWYYIVIIVGILLILIGYFAAQMFINRREEEFLKGEDGEK